MKTTSTQLVALLLAAAACRSADRSAPQRVVVASFTGQVDAATGSVTIQAEPASGGAAGPHLAAVELPVATDGVPGSGPPDTIELVTERVTSIAAGCGAVDALEAAIRVRSFYAGAVLANVHVELVSLTPTGHEACNSAAPTGSLSAAYGLWDYGAIGRAGSGFSSALRPWRFRVPDQTGFSFRGHVVGDLVTSDGAPPVTTATPGAGTYGPGRSVALACVDAETGCAATYYTTDGSTPTTASAVYSAPIPIAGSFTLRWFSVDLWGNAEAVRSAAYVLDATPPAVAAVTPSAGQVNVATSTTVAVTFTEPVDPATVTAASLSVSGPGGPIAGTLATDGASRTFTFTPAAPLVAEALYTVAVTAAVRDLAGNALSPAFTSTFYSVTAPGNVQPGTSATLLNHAVAYDNSGNGLAAWSATTQGGTAVVFSTYTASAGTWSAATVLQAERGNGLGFPVRVVSDGSRFLVVWCTTAAVRAVQIQNNVPGSIADVITGGASLVPSALAVSATGTANRFFIARGFQWNIEAWSWNGSAWSAKATIDAGNTPVLSGSALYYLGGDNASVKTVSFNGTAWGTPSNVATTDVSIGSPMSLAVAAGYPSTVVAYGTTTGHVWAAVGSGTSWTPTDVSGFGSESSQPLAVAAGAYSTEFAVAWITASGKALGAFRNNGLWPSSPTSLAASGAAEVAVAGYSYGLVAALAVRDAGSTTASLLASPSAGSFNARTWTTPVVVESGASPAAEPGVVATGTSAVIHWTQADATAHEVLLRPYGGSSLGTAQIPSAPPLPGSPSSVRFAANAAGEVLAVWVQDDGGAPNVFAALHRATGWTTPVKAVPRGYAPDVASNGSDFLIVAVAPSATTVGARNVVAVPVTGGAPGAAEVVVSGAAGAPRVASDGQGYAAIWSLGTAVQGAMRGGGVWLPVHGFGSGQGGSVAGRSGEYVFAWVTNSPSGDVSHVRSAGSGATWAWGSQGYGSQYGAEVEVSSGSSGFFVVARSTAGMVDGWTVVGGVKGATISVGYGQWPCSGGLRTASSGARFLVGWNCSNSLATAETDGVTAPTSVAHRTGAPGLTPTALGFAIAGGRPGSFRLLYSWGDQFNVANVFRRDSAAGAWGSTGTVDQRPQATQATVAVAWDGGAYLALWGQTTTASPIVDDLVAWWAF